MVEGHVAKAVRVQVPLSALKCPRFFAGVICSQGVFMALLSDPNRRDLWMARIYYFSYMGGWGFILPFTNLFYVSLGLSGKQIGTFASTSAVVGLIMAPLWVSEAKKRPNPRRYLQFALVMSALGYLVIGHQTEFLPIVIIIFLQTFTSSGISPMSDSMAVSVAQTAETGYGGIRVWASLGWIVTVLMAGWLIESFGYQIGFLSTCVALIFASFLLIFIRKQNFASHILQGQPKATVRTAVEKITTDRTLLGFAFALMLITFLNSGVVQFENVFLSQLGASKRLISVAGILSATVEIPFMIWSDRILRRYGAHRLLLVALLMNAFLRMTVLAIPSIYTIMTVRFIGGVSFSLYTVSFVGLVSGRTSSAERGTVLALFTATLVGLVNIVASPIAGALFDALGARWLYAFSAAGYFGAVICMWWGRPRERLETI
jgi:MFS transporter, PPP family, 3-phenylpropionic acid transporter